MECSASFTPVVYILPRGVTAAVATSHFYWAVHNMTDDICWSWCCKWGLFRNSIDTSTTKQGLLSRGPQLYLMKPWEFQGARSQADTCFTTAEFSDRYTGQGRALPDRIAIPLRQRKPPVWTFFQKKQDFSTVSGAQYFCSPPGTSEAIIYIPQWHTAPAFQCSLLQWALL